MVVELHIYKPHSDFFNHKFRQEFKSLKELLEYKDMRERDGFICAYQIVGKDVDAALGITMDSDSVIAKEGI